MSHGGAEGSPDEAVVAAVVDVEEVVSEEACVAGTVAGEPDASTA